MSRPDKNRAAGRVRSTLDRLDFYQRRHPTLGVPIAVARKFVEDESINLAAVIAFWAFFSVFPLLLIFVTILGYVLPPALQGEVLRSVASFFPLLNPDSIGHLSGQWWTLVLGILSALWSGSFVVIAVQSAFNSVWEIPYAHRPSFSAQMRRGIFALGVIALGLIVSTVMSSYVTGSASRPSLGVVAHVAAYLIAVALDVALYIMAFRLLTAREIATRNVLPGALLSGLAFWVLQQLSSFIIFRYLHNAERIYGNFATVITILSWFYLQSVITLVGAQFNVVLTERLHPRRLVTTPVTEADHRAYDAYVKERTYHQDQHIHTEFRQREADEG